MLQNEKKSNKKQKNTVNNKKNIQNCMKGANDKRNEHKQNKLHNKKNK